MDIPTNQFYISIFLLRSESEVTKRNGGNISAAEQALNYMRKLRGSRGQSGEQRTFGLFLLRILSDFIPAEPFRDENRVFW